MISKRIYLWLSVLVFIAIIGIGQVQAHPSLNHLKEIDKNFANYNNCCLIQLRNSFIVLFLPSV